MFDMPYMNSVLAVWARMFNVWRRLIWSSVAQNFVTPVIYLFAFGYGLGAVVEQMDGIDYMTYVVPGMLAYSLMFASSFESSIVAFARFTRERVWDAILSTPITLQEVILGEALWSASKGLLSGIAVFIIGYLFGGIDNPLTFLLVIPLSFVAGMTFAMAGLFASSMARGYEFFAYFFTFWVTPMFMFSGVFFPVDRFPDYVEYVSWLLPMTHYIQVIRPIMTGVDVNVLHILGHFAYLIVLTVACYSACYYKLSRRLFD